MKTNRKYNLVFLFICLLITGAMQGQTQSFKRGLGYDFPAYEDLTVVNPGVSWYYNWDIHPNWPWWTDDENYYSTNMDFIPMTWSQWYDENSLRSFLATHPTVKYILAFNEPNFKDQANMTPSEVAAAWPRLQAIADEFGLQIVGPALNWCGDCVEENGTVYNDPVQFYDDFFTICPECRVDFIGIHYYVPNVTVLREQIGRLRKYNRPVWLTEFNMDKGIRDNGTMDEQREYMVAALDYLEQEPLVFRYAWFVGRTNEGIIDILGPNTGELTTLGEVYTYMSSYDANYFHTINHTIEAEHYIRMSGISLIRSTDVSGHISVGYTDHEDWLEYNLEVSAAGTYNINIRVAAPSAGVLTLYSNEQYLEYMDIYPTGGWETWTTISKPIQLPAGKQTFKIKIDAGGFDINWFSITTP